MVDMVERLVWLYYIAALFTLILGVWLGHVITLAAQRAEKELNCGSRDGNPKD